MTSYKDLIDHQLREPTFKARSMSDKFNPLALGKEIYKMIPYSRQSISRKDILSVSKVLKSNFLTQGPLVQKFEKKISNLFNSKYALASNSGSSALHLACLALNIKPKMNYITIFYLVRFTFNRYFSFFTTY